MNLRKQISNAFGRLIGGFWPRFGGWGWSRVRTFLPSARFDWVNEAGDTWENSIVALAISWLGDRFSRPLIHVSKIAKGGDYVPLGRHDLTDLWNRPNAFYGRRTMEKAIGLSIKVDGNAYIHKVRDRSGKPVELWWIPHNCISPTWPEDGSAYIDGYRVSLDSGDYPVPLEDIIHIRDGIDPNNQRLGLSALHANIREVVTVNMESTYTAAILKNAGVPGLAIVPDDSKGMLKPSEPDSKRIKERFQDSTSGDLVGSPVVMMGPYKITPLGFSPENMILDKLPQNAISRIAAAIGVAPMCLGLPDPGKTYSNLEEANRTSWGTIVSVQELVSDTLRWQLLPDFKTDPHSFTIEYDYSNVQELQESLDAIHSRARDDFKFGVCTLNEAREMVGREPDPDGDRYYPGTGDDAEIPTTMQIQQQPGAQPAKVAEVSKALALRNGWHT